MKAIFSVAGLMAALFAALLFILTPSIIQPIVATAFGIYLGIILIRNGLLKRKAGIITILVTASFLSGMYLVMTQSVTAGRVAETSPFTEIDAFLKAQKFSGSVLIAQEGKVLLSKGYGYANRNRMVPNTPQTKFRIGSVTKQFTAMAILMLQKQGRLSVHDKICRYISDCPAAWGDITIHQLLTHTSGIPDFSSASLWGDMTEEEIITIFKSKPLEFKPGEKYNYSNTGYVLLGSIIEQVSGESYGEFLQENIFAPLNMTNSGYDIDGDIGTVGYISPFFKPLPFSIKPKSYAAGWVHSTVEDLYRWDEALYAEQLIPQELLDEMFAAHVTTSTGMSYGYGWEVGKWYNRRVVRHSGHETGFKSWIYRFPDDRIVFIVLSNEQNADLDPILSYISQRIFEEK